MYKPKLPLIFLTLFILFTPRLSTTLTAQKPSHFVYLDAFLKNSSIDLRYLGYNNFVGRPIDGYHSNRAVGTLELALALANVEKELNSQGLSLKILDSYRPMKAVYHFVRWAKNFSDTLTKAKYYPTYDKKNLFALGFISSKSTHTRGSTVDLTLIDLKTGLEIDMGSEFDIFSEKSSHSYSNLTDRQKKSRQLLKSTMEKYFFHPYSKEWWHYSFKGEKDTKTMYNFNIE